MRRRWPTSLSRPRRDAWSLGWSRRCSVSAVMRSLSTATWTSAEPVSVSWRRCSAMISDLGLTIGTFVRESIRDRYSTAFRIRAGKERDRAGKARDRRRGRAHLLALDVEEQRAVAVLDAGHAAPPHLHPRPAHVAAAVQRGHGRDRPGAAAG